MKNWVAFKKKSTVPIPFECPIVRYSVENFLEKNVADLILEGYTEEEFEVIKPYNLVVLYLDEYAKDYNKDIMDEFRAVAQEHIDDIKFLVLEYQTDA